jgi:hypothetical protein
VLEVSDRCEETSYLILTEDDREDARLFDRGDAVGEVAAAQGDTVEESQGGADFLILAQRDASLLYEVKQVGANVLGAEVLR